MAIDTKNNNTKQGTISTTDKQGNATTKVVDLVVVDGKVVPGNGDGVVNR